MEAMSCSPRALLPVHREMRVSVCKHCNFDCLFCHSEGLDRSGPDTRRSVGQILDLLRRAMALGFCDITFTGGEPLLRHADIATMLCELGTTPSPPALTVVTNASIVPDSLIAAACVYPGPLKFNVSVHSTDPDGFRQITQSEMPLDRVLGNVRRMTEAGLRVKLNTVVLKGINSGPSSLRAHLDVARSLGVTGVKLLELLVTPANRVHYELYYSDNAIARDLAQLEFAVKTSNRRTVTLACPEMPGLGVEITRCTCRAGCGECADLRDRQFDSALALHPCFVLSDKSFAPGDSVETLTAALQAGEEHVARLAGIYGQDSPTLVPREAFVSGKQEVFFTTELTATECEARLRALELSAAKRRDFHLIYCLPQDPDDTWLDCRHVLKYGFDGHTPNRYEIIISSESYEKHGELLVCTRRYLAEQPAEIPGHTRAKAEAFMRAFGYVTWFERTFCVLDYSSPDQADVLSLDTAGPAFNVKVTPDALDHPVVRKALAALEVSPIPIPFTAWAAGQAEAEPAPRI
jgi:molybdenum cofactor biosynthesis enzyme MoaA